MYLTFFHYYLTVNVHEILSKKNLTRCMGVSWFWTRLHGHLVPRFLYVFFLTWRFVSIQNTFYYNYINKKTFFDCIFSLLFPITYFTYFTLSYYDSSQPFALINDLLYWESLNSLHMLLNNAVEKNSRTFLTHQV